MNKNFIVYLFHYGWLQHKGDFVIKRVKGNTSWSRFDDYKNFYNKYKYTYIPNQSNPTILDKIDSDVALNFFFTCRSDMIGYVRIEQ